jgi:hypothetical protein
VAGVGGKINEGVVHVDDVLALLGEGLGVEELHFGGGLVERDDAGDLEVGDHHDGVRALAAEAGHVLDDGFGVHVVELDLVLDDVFEDACYQTSSSDLESVDDFKQLREECFAIAEAYGARNSKDKVKFYYEKDNEGKDTGSTDLDALVEEAKAEQKADEEAEAKRRAEEQAAREAEEANETSEESEESSEEKADEE